MNEAVVLGSGSSVPTIERFHPAFAVRWKGEIVLFDCGEGAQIRLSQAKLSPMKINHIFISHFHGDHYFGLPGLLYTMSTNQRKEPLHLHLPDKKFGKKILSFCEDPLSYEVILSPPEFEAKDWGVCSIKNKHTKNSVSYLFYEKDRVNIRKKALSKHGIPDGPHLKKLRKGNLVYKGKKYKREELVKIRPGKKIGYSGDSPVFPGLSDFYKNADILFHEATFNELHKDKAEKFFHSTLEDVQHLAEKAKIKKLVLFHFSRRYHDLEKLKKKIFFKNTLFAEDLMRIKI